MQPFITFRDIEDGELRYFILQRAFPNYVAVISESPFVKEGKRQWVPSVPLTDHNLWIEFWGTVQGRYMPGYKDVFEEVKDVMESMALWFYNERVSKDLKKYKKWNLQP